MGTLFPYTTLFRSGTDPFGSCKRLGGAAMGHYIGVDLHQKTSFITKVDEKGKVLQQIHLKNDPETLKSFFKKQPIGSQVVVEATGHWYHFYELIEDRFPDLVLAHPQKVKAIAD